MQRAEPAPSLIERLATRIGAGGPLRFSAFMDAALYDDDAGFYAAAIGRAGRRGDFLTSVEVGPLFGAVLARAIDRWWDELGRPSPFAVVDAGAGPGTLARAVLAASSECARAGALDYVAVELSAAQRANHPGGVTSSATMPSGPVTGIVVANELVDNLAFDIAVWDGGWRLATVSWQSGRFVELLAPMPADLAALVACLPTDAAHGARAPLAVGAATWLTDALDRLERGRVVLIDYSATTTALAARPWRDWLRTYRGHERGGHPLVDPGTQDITADVPLDQLASAVRPADATSTQAAFLARHGIDDLVAEGKRVWAERAHIGDLVAIQARSRLREHDALTDAAGLGAFTVAEWIVG